MANPVCEIPINQLTSQLTMTIKIKGVKRWQLRLWLAKYIFLISSFVVSRLIGTKLEIEKELNG